MRDLTRDLDSDGDVPVEAWRPEEGAKLVGTVVRYEQATSQYGKRWIAVVRVDATPTQQTYLANVWLHHAVLFGEFQKQRPKPGERIGIKRLEDSDKGYARYRLVVDRAAGGEPNWDTEKVPEEGGHAQR